MWKPIAIRKYNRRTDGQTDTEMCIFTCPRLKTSLCCELSRRVHYRLNSQLLSKWINSTLFRFSSFSLSHFANGMFSFLVWWSFSATINLQQPTTATNFQRTTTATNLQQPTTATILPSPTTATNLRPPITPNDLQQLTTAIIIDHQPQHMI